MRKHPDEHQLDTDGRRIDLNQGVIADLTIPADRHIVGAFIVTLDEHGQYGAYLSSASSIDAPDTHQPTPEVSIELAAHIAQAFSLANI